VCCILTHLFAIFTIVLQTTRYKVLGYLIRYSFWEIFASYMVVSSRSQVLGSADERQSKFKQRKRPGSRVTVTATPKPSVKEVAGGIFLYTTRVRDGNDYFFVYEVECVLPRPQSLRFSIDFSGSTNLMLLGTTSAQTDTRTEQQLMAEVTAVPFSRVVVARVAIKDPNQGGIIRNTFNWDLLDPPAEREVTAAVQANVHSISRLMERMAPLSLAGDGQACGGTGLGRGTAVSKSMRASVDDIVKRCHAHGVLYVDPLFPPTDVSLGPSLARKAAWRRPCDFPDAFCPPPSSFSLTSAAATSELRQRRGSKKEAFLLSLARQRAFGTGGQPSPNDVRGAVMAADASLTCALKALASRPHLVHSALSLHSGREVTGGRAGLGTGKSSDLSSSLMSG
ncbi:unnamed protein product, partial [Choristocarpus tenellus]